MRRCVSLQCSSAALEQTLLISTRNWETRFSPTDARISTECCLVSCISKCTIESSVVAVRLRLYSAVSQIRDVSWFVVIGHFTFKCFVVICFIIVQYYDSIVQCIILTNIILVLQTKLSSAVKSVIICKLWTHELEKRINVGTVWPMLASKQQTLNRW